MATIDELDFKVILDDEEFNTRVSKDIKKAQNLNIQLSHLLQVKQHVNRISQDDVNNNRKAQQVAVDNLRAQEKITREVEKTNREKLKTTKLEEKLNAQIKRTGESYSSQSRILNELKNIALGYLSIHAGSQLISSIVRVTGEFEMQRTTLSAMLGDMNQAEQILTRIKGLAVESPFEFKELAAYTKQLSAFSVPVEELYDTTKMLADVSAGLGVGMDRIILAYGQVRSAAFLRGCLGYDTEIVMYDGSKKKVQDIVAGDLLRGDDNKPRVVKELIRGKEQMYTVSGNGYSYRVNQNHILTLFSKKLFKVVDVYVSDYLAYPNNFLGVCFDKDEHITYEISVKKDKVDDYYGFVIDQNKRFLIGDNVVTHNTEVRQFTEAGIPILDELAKQFSELEGRAVSAGEVFDKISARLVPFEMVAKVFKDMTSEGGKFYNMQEIQAETLQGKISNLRDAYEMMLNEIGEAHSDKLKGGVDALRDLMKNWEKIGTIISALIVSFGFYKGTLAAVWAYEKAMAAGKSIKYFIALTKRVNLATAAFRAFGITSEAAAGGILGILGAVGTIIISAVNNANALDRELDSILNKEAAGSDKLVDGLDRLVSKLEGATQGTQNYRDAISELNNKYGDYLPNLLTEKNTLEEIKTAADAAALAIRNKAKATAFDEGYAAIEEEYGNKIRDSIKGLKDALFRLSPDIGTEYAAEFIQVFKAALSKEGAEKDVLDTFRKTFDTYFGEGAYKKYTAKYLKPEGLEDAAMNYYKAVRKAIKKEQELQRDIDIRFSGAEFSSIKEREAILELDKWYKTEETAIKRLEISQGEYNDKIEALDIEKLRKLVQIYTDLGRPEIAKGYQEQLDAITKIPEGWRGVTQTVLKGMNLTKGTSFGLWAEDTTQSTSYVDDMIKRYKELGEQIKMVSSFDTDQAERLEKNKETIEAVADALDIDLVNLSQKTKRTNTETINGFIKARVNALKHNADVIKEAMDKYNGLLESGFYTDDMAREFLGKVYGDTAAFKKGITTWSTALEDALKKSEGLRLEAYKDTGGVWTIGYGHTEGVNQGDTITVEQAEAMLKQDLAVRGQQLNEIIETAGLELTQGQYDALFDFTYNAGIGSLKKLIEEAVSIEEIGKKLLTSNLTDRKGQMLPGLIKRRAEEYEMFMGDIALAVDDNGLLMVNFEEKIREVISALRALGPEGVKAAVQVEASFDKLLRKNETDRMDDKLKEIFKSVSKYYEKISEWSGKDFNLGETGVTFDIKKIASDLATEFNEIERRTEKMKLLLKEAALAEDDGVLENIRIKFEEDFGPGIWERFWADYITNGEDAIDRISKAEADSAKATAKDKIQSLAEAKVKELTRGLDMTDWADKSLYQINQIQAALRNLLNGGFTLADSETEKKLKSLGLSLDDLEKVIKEILSGKYNDTVIEKFKKLQTKANEINSTFGEIGDSLISIGDMFDSDFARGFGEMLETAEEFANILIECDSLWNSMADGAEEATSEMENIAKSSDWITMIIKAVLLIINKIAEGVHETSEATRAVKNEALEYARILDEIEFNDRMDSFETIFGTDSFNKFKQALKEVEEYQQRIADTIKSIGTPDEQEYIIAAPSISIKYGDDGISSPEFNSNDLADNMVDLDEYIKQLESLRKVKSGTIKIDRRTGWQRFFNSSKNVFYTDISEFLDADGKLMTEKLREFYNTNSNYLDDETRQNLADMLAYGERYEEAMKEVNGYVSSLFKSLASDIADSMINSFLEVGDAASGLDDVFVNLGQSIAKSLLESFILDEVLDKYKDEINGLFVASKGLTDKEFADRLYGFTDNVKEDITDIGEFFNAFLTYWQEAGLLDSSQAGGDSLGNGIKSITEDTANLLASYLNAIRADVSYSKTLWMRMDANTQRIAVMLLGFSAPNLMEYQAQIAANTYDTAVATQGILSELKELFTYDGGYKAIRVFS